MKISGCIFLIISWGIVILLVSFCYINVLKKK